jgi:hypothetical protein
MKRVPVVIKRKDKLKNRDIFFSLLFFVIPILKAFQQKY